MDGYDPVAEVGVPDCLDEVSESGKVVVVEDDLSRTRVEAVVSHDDNPLNRRSAQISGLAGAVGLCRVAHPSDAIRGQLAAYRSQIRHVFLGLPLPQEPVP